MELDRTAPENQRDESNTSGTVPAYGFFVQHRLFYTNPGTKGQQYIPKKVQYHWELRLSEAFTLKDYDFPTPQPYRQIN